MSSHLERGENLAGHASSLCSRASRDDIIITTKDGRLQLPEKPPWNSYVFWLIHPRQLRNQLYPITPLTIDTSREAFMNASSQIQQLKPQTLAAYYIDPSGNLSFASDTIGSLVATSSLPPRLSDKTIKYKVSNTIVSPPIEAIFQNLWGSNRYFNDMQEACERLKKTKYPLACFQFGELKQRAAETGISQEVIVFDHPVFLSPQTSLDIVTGRISLVGEPSGIQESRGVIQGLT